MFTLCPTLRCKSCRGFAPSLAFFLCRLRSFAQRLRSCSQIRHVKCSEMYLIVILNPKKTKASAEESPVGQMSCRPNHKCLVDRPNVLSAKCLSVKGPVGQTSVGLVSVGQMSVGQTSGHAM